jgi:hypothetical protein
MKKIKKTEDIVLDVLENNLKARQDDFILYGAVLKRLGVDLKQTLYEFLAKAKENKMPSFETVTRCRRHIQELRLDLVDNKTAIAREENIERFKEYNLSDVREKDE